jgi:hypothetical protein
MLNRYAVINRYNVLLSRKEFIFVLEDLPFVRVANRAPELLFLLHTN